MTLLGLPLALPLALALTLAATSCSIVPNGGYPDSRELDVVVRYDLEALPQSTISLPQSNANLTILDLEVDPPDVRETFVGGRRVLIPAAGTRALQLRCRYRVWQEPAADGAPRPFPSPRTLFPEATEIRVHQQQPQY